MKINVLSLVILMLINILSFGQDNIQIPTDPLLGDLTNISNGTLKVKIPLYTIKEDELNIPIYLSYDGSGVKLNDRSSCVGLKWTLNTGAYITRAVTGIPDENSFEQNGIGYPRHIDGNFTGIFEDVGPDLFTYSINGKTGSFYLQPDKKSIISASKSDYLILRNNNNKLGNISPFQAITTEGVVYDFLQGEIVNLPELAYSQLYRPYTNIFPVKYIYLKNNATIEYKYSNYLAHSFNAVTKHIINTSSIRGTYSERTNDIYDSQYQVYNCTEIVTPNIKVEFIYKSNERKAAGEHLKYIKVYNLNSGKLIKHYAFYYTFKEYERYYLTSIDELGTNGTLKELYVFNYNLKPLPQIYTSNYTYYNKENFSKQDFFGYYNSNTENHLFPFNLDNTYTKANRFFDEAKLQIGLLKSIVTPESAVVEYKYIPNYDSTNDRYGGGVLLKEIKQYSGQKLLRHQIFDYKYFQGHYMPNTISKLDKLKHLFHEYNFLDSYYDNLYISNPRRYLRKSISLNPDESNRIQDSYCYESQHGSFYRLIISKDNISSNTGRKETHYTEHRIGKKTIGIPEITKYFTHDNTLKKLEQNYYKWYNKNSIYYYKRKFSKRRPGDPYSYTIQDYCNRNLNEWRNENPNDYRKEEYICGKLELTKKVSTNYENSKSFSTSKEMLYTSHDQIRSIETKSEEETIGYKYYKYCYDYSTSNGTWLQNLKDNHIYQPIIIAQGPRENAYHTIIQNRYNNNGLIARTLKKESYNSTCTLPGTQNSDIVTNGFKNIATYSYNSDNRINQNLENVDQVSSIIWNGNEIIARVNNAHRNNIAYNSFESNTLESWSNYSMHSDDSYTGNNCVILESNPITYSSKQFITGPKKLKINYWTKRTSNYTDGTINVKILLKDGTSKSFNRKIVAGNDWTNHEETINISSFYNKINEISYSFSGSTLLIDEIRIFPSESVMTTYGYNSKGFLMYECNAISNTIKYEYDGFGRISTIRDNRDNILEQRKYDNLGLSY